MLLLGQAEGPIAVAHLVALEAMSGTLSRHLCSRHRSMGWDNNDRGQDVDRVIRRPRSGRFTSRDRTLGSASSNFKPTTVGQEWPAKQHSVWVSGFYVILNEYLLAPLAHTR